jgi:hypothetical protein
MFVPCGGVGNASLTISSNDTLFVVTVFFWPFTMIDVLAGLGRAAVEVLILAKVHRLVVVLDNGVFAVAFDLAEKVIARLDVTQRIERLARCRVRRLVELLVDVNTHLMLMLVMCHVSLRWLKAALV